AIAGGGFSGKGLNNDSPTSVKNANFISEPETDFIFTIIGEELGFIGTLATIVLLGLIIFECFRIGYRAREQIGRSIAVGYGTLIAVQSFINIGVNTMIIPNTGLTLPFVSYGLSSLITSFVGIGLILNVGLRKKITF
ncbi:MAG: FtsW/RodA/SpoVE family cell cycle protein, partial [Lachnospiraceae bacterium]|nr:FtsW/RodA/SpoVE family cell cycle protein [Lachnospiraceae bacterium]